MLYRIEDDVVIIDNIFHELQDYENILAIRRMIQANLSKELILSMKDTEEEFAEAEAGLCQMV